MSLARQIYTTAFITYTCFYYSYFARCSLFFLQIIKTPKKHRITSPKSPASYMTEWHASTEWWLGHTTYEEATCMPYILFSPSLTQPCAHHTLVEGPIKYGISSLLFPLHFKRSSTVSSSFPLQQRQWKNDTIMTNLNSQTLKRSLWKEFKVKQG